MKLRILKFCSLWLPLVLWALLIFNFSSGAVPVTTQVHWQDFVVKKTGHMLLFGTFAILLYRALRGEGVERKNAVITAIVLATFYGATDEYHQLFTQGREGRIRDVGFDFAGAALATYLLYAYLPKFSKKYLDFARSLGLF